MTEKLSTRARKETAKMAALRQRIGDIASGARGADFDPGGDTCESLTLADLPRFLSALRERLPALSEDRCKHLTGTWRLDQFETINEATEHLWSHGIRA